MKLRASSILFLLSVAAYILLLFLCPGAIVTAFLGIPLYCWLCTLLHELAHLTAYKLLGLPWKRFCFSIFTFANENGTLQFRTELAGKTFRGECVCAYLEDAPLWKYSVALLSGGIFCALVGIGAFLLLLLFPDSYLLWSLGVIFSLNALINLLPPVSGDLQMLRAITSKKRNHTL